MTIIFPKLYCISAWHSHSYSTRWLSYWGYMYYKRTFRNHVFGGIKSFCSHNLTPWTIIEFSKPYKASAWQPHSYSKRWLGFCRYCKKSFGNYMGFFFRDKLFFIHNLIREWKLNFQNLICTTNPFIYQEIIRLF